MNNWPKPSTLFLKLISFRVSQIKVWLLDKTTLLIFFSNSLIIERTGNAVQDTNNASLLVKSILVNVSNKYCGSTLPMSRSDAISK